MTRAELGIVEIEYSFLVSKLNSFQNVFTSTAWSSLKELEFFLSDLGDNPVSDELELKELSERL